MWEVWNARWRFSDGIETYSFKINPSDADSPWRDNVVEPVYTTDNKVLLIQGNPQPRTMSFSGTILDTNQYDAFVSWLKRSRKVYLYDHWDRQMIVIVTSFQPKPKRTTFTYPYAHEYNMSVLVIQEPQ